MGETLCVGNSLGIRFCYVSMCMDVCDVWCAQVGVCGSEHAMPCMWRSDDNFRSQSPPSTLRQSLCCLLFVKLIAP